MKTKREDILRAAEEEFARNGYEGASISRIAKRVGVTHVLLYYHFQDKEHLFAEVLGGKVEALIQAVLPETMEGVTFLTNLDSLISRTFDFIAENALLARLLVNELTPVRSFYAEAHRLYDPYIAQMQAAIDAEVAAGRIRPVRAVDVMRAICSLNIMAVTVTPAIATLLPEEASDLAARLAQRKAENIRYIHALLEADSPEQHRDTPEPHNNSTDSNQPLTEK